MILSRLKVLMAERNLKISQIANDTGLSRTTLTALSNNTLKGIRLDTINTLCQYLNISTNEFFDYLPFDIDVNIKWDGYNETTLSVVKKMNSRVLGKSEKIFSLTGKINRSDDASDLDSSIQTIEVLLGEPTDNEVYKSQVKDFNSFLDSLKGGFKELFFQQVKEKLKEGFNLKSDLSSYKFKFSFNNAFEVIDDDLLF